MSQGNRDRYLEEGYRKLFGKEPEPGMNDWQIAALVMEGLDPRVLGAKLSKQCIFRVFNYLLQDVDEDLIRSVWFLAESNARQFFWPNLPEEIHRDDMAALEYLESSGFWSKVGD
ncbi:MAG: hypothetical protein HYX21_03110 [Candidatus Yanofskybacteria bacterium]|nr:hypothetical protein [Candidatus Yanofskybacteria bacterium]